MSGSVCYSWTNTALEIGNPGTFRVFEYKALPETMRKSASMNFRPRQHLVHLHFFHIAFSVWSGNKDYDLPQHCPDCADLFCTERDCEQMANSSFDNAAWVHKYVEDVRKPASLPRLGVGCRNDADFNSQPPKRPQNRRWSFLDLPRNIRDLVYSELLDLSLSHHEVSNPNWDLSKMVDSITQALDNSFHNPRCCAVPTTDKYEYNASIFRTNKQINKAATNIWRESNDFIIVYTNNESLSDYFRGHDCNILAYRGRGIIFAGI